MYTDDFIRTAEVTAVAALCAALGLSPNEAQRVWDIVVDTQVSLPLTVGEVVPTFIDAIDQVRSERRR